MDEKSLKQELERLKRYKGLLKKIKNFEDKNISQMSIGEINELSDTYRLKHKLEDELKEESASQLTKSKITKNKPKKKIRSKARKQFDDIDLSDYCLNGLDYIDLIREYGDRHRKSLSRQNRERGHSTSEDESRFRVDKAHAYAEAKVQSMAQRRIDAYNEMNSPEYQERIVKENISILKGLEIPF